MFPLKNLASKGLNTFDKQMIGLLQDLLDVQSLVMPDILFTVIVLYIK